MLVVIIILGVLNLFWLTAITFAVHDAVDYLRAIAHPFLEADEAAQKWLGDDMWPEKTKEGTPRQRKHTSNKRTNSSPVRGKRTGRA